MKNYLTLVLALSVVSSPAFASRARLESLGEGKNGSFYIDDSRNMFLNPASIVRYKKKMMLELGGEPVSDIDSATTPTSVGTDNANRTRAQGGFTNTFGDFTYALYLNNTSDRAISTIEAINAGVILGGGDDNQFLTPSNGIEFALAGEGSVTWGISLLYGGNRDVYGETGATLIGSERRASYLAARFGVEKDAAAVFGTVGIMSSSKVIAGTANPEVKGKLALDLGATYKMDDMTLFGKFLSTGADFVNSTAGATAAAVVEARNTTFGVGAGWKKEMTKSTNMFTRIEAAHSKVTTTGAAATRIYNVPVTLGAETQALSWLTVRGSIGHTLLGQNLTTKANLAGNSVVAAGLGMTFGDLTVDGLVATNGNTSADTLGMGTSPAASDNFGFGDNMISRIAMTYNF
jgi:hypothetical protein